MKKALHTEASSVNAAQITIKKPRKSLVSRPVIAIPAELAEPLKEFGRETGMPVSRVAAVGLTAMLAKLRTGQAAIINGKFVDQDKATEPGRAA